MRTPAVRKEQVEVFRRRRFSAPHRRRRLWFRLLKPFAAALLVVGVPSTIGMWVATSMVFRIDELVVSSAGRVSPQLAQERLEQLRGRHILTLGLEDVEAALGDQAWLRGVQISKRLPSKLEVRLLERRSVALLRGPEGLFYVDRQGEVIARYEPRSGEGDYVLVKADAGDSDSIRGALALAEAWQRHAGSWAEGLSEIEVVDALSFRIHSSDLDFPVLVTRENFEVGLAALRTQLPRINRYYPALEVADLRFSGQIVFQPAAEPGTEG